MSDDEEESPQTTHGSTSASKSSVSSNSSTHPLHRIRRATGLIFKRIALADFDSDSDTSSCDQEMVNTSATDETKNEEVDEQFNKKSAEEEAEAEVDSYTYWMRHNISDLPLPLVLKSYLNFYRKL